MRNACLDPDDRATSCIDVYPFARQRDVREQSKMYVRQVELNQLVDRLKRKAMNSLKLKGTEGAKTKARIALRRKLDGEGNR